MAGRHIAKTSKSSKMPLVILCIVAVIIIAAVICAIIFMNNGGVTETPTEATQSETTVEQTTIFDEITSAVDSQATTVVDTTQEQGVTHTHNEEETVDVVVPTNGGEEVSYFNATYVPDSAVDSASGEACSLKEVFGSSYTGGVITFNSDGTFTDTVTSSSVHSGAYVVEGSSIVATYTNDNNMSITVNSWENGIPSEFVINYGGDNGYDVYFIS